MLISLDPDQAGHSVGPDLWVQTVCKSYQQMALGDKELGTTYLIGFGQAGIGDSKRTGRWRQSQYF